MKAFLILLLFISAIFIITGLYEQKLAVAEGNTKIEYRFIPRTFYEEQMGDGAAVSDKLGSIFNKESPWFDRTIGPVIEIEKPYQN